MQRETVLGEGKRVPVNSGKPANAHVVSDHVTCVASRPFPIKVQRVSSEGRAALFPPPRTYECLQTADQTF